MRAERLRLIAACLLPLLWVAVVGAGETPAPSPPEPTTARDEENQVEVQLPAPYWRHVEPQELAQRGPAGCAPARVPPNLLFLLNHKDALASVWCERIPGTFLMRDRDDLESYLHGFTQTVRGQVRGAIGDVEESWAEREGAIVHEFAFSADPPAGGGCAGAAPANAPRMRYRFAHFFVRPPDADARGLKLFAAAPEGSYERIEAELDFIFASFRYTGQTAGEFFVPDAPQEKVLTAEDASRAVGGRSNRTSWLLPIGLIVIIYLMMRRRKQPAAT